MSTRVRNVPGVQVSREERAKWLGHADSKHSMTETWYESFDPDHLLNPMRATDAILKRLATLTRRSLIPPNTSADGRLTIVWNDDNKQTGTDD